MNDEETGKWLVVYFFRREPMQLYGLFDTEAEAHAYARTHGKTTKRNAYSVHMVLNAHVGWAGTGDRDGKQQA
jgi:hypothetical protein